MDLGGGKLQEFQPVRPPHEGERPCSLIFA